MSLIRFIWLLAKYFLTHLVSSRSPHIVPTWIFSNACTNDASSVYCVDPIFLPPLSIPAQLHNDMTAFVYHTTAILPLSPFLIPALSLTSLVMQNKVPARYMLQVSFQIQHSSMISLLPFQSLLSRVITLCAHIYPCSWKHQQHFSSQSISISHLPVLLQN